MPQWPITLTSLAYLALLAVCTLTASWQRLADDHRQNAWMGLTVAMLLMWSMPARVGGIDLHFAGASLAALMFGVRLGTISIAIAQVIAWITGRVATADAALYGIFYSVLPALLTISLQRLIQARLPRHIFVYIFVTCFGATLIANVVSTVSFALAYPWLSGTEHASPPADFLAYRLLLCWGESMLTGMLMAIFVVYRPLWVSTFRDDIYLSKTSTRQD